jgi:long-chain acyl-CoA synthetase
MMAQTLVDKLIENSRNYSDKTALISGQDATLTYSQLIRHVYGAARLLKNKGVKPEERVLVTAEHSFNFIVFYYAIHLINAITVPIHPKIKTSTLEYIIQQTQPKALLFPRNFDLSPYPGSGYLDEYEPEDSGENLYENPDIEDTADILFTTGTTGFPKGVMLSHKNIVAGVVNTNEFIENDDSDREIVPLPLHHAFGLRRVRANLYTGGSVILVEGFLFPGRIYSAIENWNATGLCIVPEGFNVLLRLTGDTLGKYKSRLKYMEIGSSAMSADKKEHLMQLLPSTKLCMHYGLTEAAANIFTEFHRDKDKLHSLGKASPNISIKISDDEGNECAPNEIGEIMVNGDVVMQGYWNDPELTAFTLSDGWVHTGDLGVKDEAEYIYIKGRKDDIINIGGEKVSPLEIESAINQHPNITESACVSESDNNKMTGKTITAYVVLKDKSEFDQEELITFLRNTIEEYKIPNRFEVISNLPKTPTGKIQREKLRQ